MIFVLSSCHCSRMVVSTSSTQKMKERELLVSGRASIAFVSTGLAAIIEARIIDGEHDGLRTCEWPLVGKSISIRDLLFCQQKDRSRRYRPHEKGWEMKNHVLTVTVTTGGGNALIATVSWLLISNERNRNSRIKLHDGSHTNCRRFAMVVDGRPRSRGCR